MLQSSAHLGISLSPPSMSLKHVVALVTGGASGIGLATSTRLISQGARVVLVDLPTSAGASVADELGPNARFAAADVTSEKDVSAALDLAESAFGRSINVAVSHAGISLVGITVDENHAPHPMDDFNRVLHVNAVGTFQVARLAAAQMSKQPPKADGERGVIINTASTMAFEGTIGRIAYSTSKAAIAGMTLPMARDLGRFGIRVVTIAPGAISTPMFDEMPKELQERLFSDFPFPKRSGQPEDVAHLVQAIIENPIINGETIRIDSAARSPPMV